MELAQGDAEWMFDRQKSEVVIIGCLALAIAFAGVTEPALYAPIDAWGATHAKYCFQAPQIRQDGDELGKQ